MDKCPHCPICEPDENPCMSIFFDLQRLSYEDDDTVKQLYDCFDKNYGNLYEKLNIKLYQDDIQKMQGSEIKAILDEVKVAVKPDKTMK